MALAAPVDSAAASDLVAPLDKADDRAALAVVVANAVKVVAVNAVSVSGTKR